MMSVDCLVYSMKIQNIWSRDSVVHECIRMFNVGVRIGLWCKKRYAPSYGRSYRLAHKYRQWFMGIGRGPGADTGFHHGGSGVLILPPIPPPPLEAGGPPEIFRNSTLL